MWLCVWETSRFCHWSRLFRAQAVQGLRVLLCVVLGALGSRLLNLGVLGKTEYLSLEFTHPWMSVLPLQQVKWIHTVLGHHGGCLSAVGHLRCARAYVCTNRNCQFSDINENEMYVNEMYVIDVHVIVVLTNASEMCQPSISWKQFRDSFFNTYYQVHVRDKKMQEFLVLQQNQMSLEEYITRYRHLEAYCPHFYTTNGARAGKFVCGLRDGLRSKVLTSRPRDLDEAVTMARCIEENWARTQKDHHKKAGKHSQEKSCYREIGACLHCGRMGHFIQDCHLKKERELKKPKAGPSSSRQTFRRVYATTVEELQAHDLVEGTLLIGSHIARVLFDADCRKKQIQLMTDEMQPVEFHAHKDSPTDKIMVSALKAKRLVENESVAFLVNVLTNETKSVRLQEVAVVSEYPDVFPEELSAIRGGGLMESLLVDTTRRHPLESHLFKAQAVQGPRVLLRAVLGALGFRLPNLGVLGKTEYLSLEFTHPWMSALSLQRVKWIHTVLGHHVGCLSAVGHPRCARACVCTNRNCQFSDINENEMYVNEMYVIDVLADPGQQVDQMASFMSDWEILGQL
ncbi:hypothetical protein EJ110_NYTH48690 [Nymphaea thermarum]|nr:hypothetical protein EJ110_NYTH48690 [Nymphaea thermarum]